MALVSKYPTRALKRRGKKLLNSKHSLYKKGKKVVRKMKTTTRLLTAPLQPLNYIQQNTIRTVHTTLPTTPLKIASPDPTKIKKKMSIKKLFGINTKKDRTSSPKNDTCTTPVATRTRSRKSFLRSPRMTVASASTGSEEPTFKAAGKPLGKLQILESTGSGETEATTNPNTPVRGYGDDDKTEATTAPNTPVRGRDIETNNENYGSHEQEQNEHRNQNPSTDSNKNIIVSTALSMESTSSTSANGKARSPYIFSDTDDESEEERREESKGPSRIDASSSLGPHFSIDQETQIYNLLEKELDNLESRLRRQKEARRAQTEKQLESELSEEEKDEDHIESCIEEVKIDTLLNERLQNQSRLDSAYQRFLAFLSVSKSKQHRETQIYSLLENELGNLDSRLQKEARQAQTEKQLERQLSEEEKDVGRITEEISINAKEHSICRRMNQQTRSISRILVLFLTAILFLSLLILLRVLLAAPSYNHDKTQEQAQFFFEAATRGATEAAVVSTTPMEGIHVVLSENYSKLGSTIQDRFVRLGATVASVEDEGIDCTDLDSVGKSVDSLVKKLNHKVDFLIQTGNLCLGGNKNSFQSLTSDSVQGYDVLFAGNYLSSFLVTQKILSRLEQSRFGTLVQFSSPISTLVDGSKLEMINDSTDAGRLVASVLLQQQDSYFSTMLRLPIGFAYAKLSEILQHKVLARTYPNIRTIEVTTGWTSGLVVGDESADDFFDQIFRNEEGEEFLLSSTSVANTVAENEDLQDGLYKWSQTTVWNLIAPPAQAPIVEKIMGTHVITMNSGEEDSSTVASSYFPANTAAMVTSSTLALLALKLKNMAWDSSGSSWVSSE